MIYAGLPEFVKPLGSYSAPNLNFTSTKIISRNFVGLILLWMWVIIIQLPSFKKQKQNFQLQGCCWGSCKTASNYGTAVSKKADAARRIIPTKMTLFNNKYHIMPNDVILRPPPLWSLSTPFIPISHIQIQSIVLLLVLRSRANLVKYVVTSFALLLLCHSDLGICITRWFATIAPITRINYQRRHHTHWPLSILLSFRTYHEHWTYQLCRN